MDKAFINNIQIYAPRDKAELLKKIHAEKTILIAINAEKILKRDQALEKIINSNLGYPDGVGAVLALKQKGVSATKIAGAEFWYDIVQEYHTQKSFYLIGGSDTVINKTVSTLKSEFPAINIKGFRNGYLSKEDEITLISNLQTLQPDIVFVAMGTPRQEILMDKLKKGHTALYMGLGGSFDIYSGLKKRAPKFFRQLGLEWLYRLLKEPTRFKRQSVLIKFFFLLIFRRL